MLTIDGTNNRVGIGIDTPLYKLDVEDAISATVARFLHTGASGPAKGGFLVLGQDDNAGLVANDRLGGFLF